jgi:uncharacterized RDD family membrane protein YckC
MGSALLDTTFDPETYASAEALKSQVAERLAAHRKRRGRAQAQMQMPVARARSQGLFDSPSNSSSNSTDERAARIAAVVAERYSRSQSYCAYLAAEAARAVQQAQAAAEVAALNAHAMLAAQQALLDALSRDGFDANIANAKADDARFDGQPPAELAASQDGDSGRNADFDIMRVDAEIQGSLPEELRLWPESDAVVNPAPRGRASGVRKTTSARVRSAASASEPASSVASVEAMQAVPASGQATDGALGVRFYDEAAGNRLSNAAHGIGANGPAANSPARRIVPSGYRHEEWNDAEAMALDEEIAFRQSPVFEEPAGPAMPLPANLIEFPRQLVASRKARPRLAEGPLRDEEEADPAGGQLRIFEVDHAQIDTTPAAAPATLAAAMPQWTSIWLDAPGHALAEGAIAGAQTPGVRAMNLPHAASIGRRVAAAAIDGGIILGGFLASATAFVLTACRSVLLQPGGALRVSPGHTLGHGLRTMVGQATSRPGEFLSAAALTFVFLYLLYQGLFFSLSEATPGMRCARIALCTFSEENPSRSATRWRILALLLSACPLWLGFLWAALDEERLTWHDRLCRIYQRSY